MKNKNQKRITLLTVAFLLFTGYRIITKHNSSEINNPSSESSLTVNKTEANLKIKYLKTGTDEEGLEYVSFNYEVLPAEANDKTVSLSLSWTENEVIESISDHLIYTHDQATYFVKVTMLEKANYQATLTLTSNANKNANASITIDFEQEFLGFNTSSLTMSKTLTGEAEELLLTEEEIKNEILGKSKGFLGTISVNEKEIKNLNKTLSTSSLVIVSPFKMLIKEDYNYNAAYDDAINSSSSSSAFIGKIGEYLEENLSDSEKALVREGNGLSFSATYSLTFDYYGTSHTFTYITTYNVSNTLFENATYVDVSSITTEGNIIFK